MEEEKKGEDFEVNTGMEWQEKVFHQCQLLKTRGLRGKRLKFLNEHHSSCRRH